MLNLLLYEILADILSRLPLKSLARVKCVCKPWLSLISDPVFSVMLQQKLASRGPKVLIASSCCGLQSYDCSKSFTDEGAFVKHDFRSSKDPYVKIVGSCDGLVCVAVNDDKDFFLWNPATGIYKKLPDIYLPDEDSSEHMLCMYGFGYDSSTKDYKVFCATLHGNGSLCDNKIRILATKSGSWREIQNNWCNIQCCNYYCTRPGDGFLVNGSLHWHAKWSCRHGYCTAISAFELGEEKFFSVPSPNIAATDSSNFWTLSAVDGCLCLIYSSPPHDYVDIWMMKEYGVQSSWEKVFIVENSHEFNYKRWLYPLWLTSRGAGTEVILINNGNELIRFKHKEGILERLMICPRRGALAITYTESFISPNACV